MTTTELSPTSTLEELESVYPGARRALFRNFHLGGCASCGYRHDETIAALCARSGGIDPLEMLARVREGHEADQRMTVEPTDLATELAEGGVRLLDIRSGDEYEAARIEGAHLFSQPLMQEILATWPKETRLVIIDHRGERSLDAATYFAGHGFVHARCLRGGIDAWSREVDSSIPRYDLEPS